MHVLLIISIVSTSQHIAHNAAFRQLIDTAGDPYSNLRHQRPSQRSISPERVLANAVPTALAVDLYGLSFALISHLCRNRLRLDMHSRQWHACCWPIFMPPMKGLASPSPTSTAGIASTDWMAPPSCTTQRQMLPQPGP